MDASARVRRLKILLWSLPGAFLGFLGGLMLALEVGGPGAIFYPFLGALLGGGGVFGVVYLIMETAGSAAGTIYNPSGSSVPYKTQYSYAASLVARGEHEDALTAYKLSVAEEPAEPEPYLRIARLLRDEMGRHEEAARWFRRVRTDTTLPPAQEVLVSRELVELYRTRLDEPLKAAPELARIAERYEDTPDGEWARRELAEVKAMIRARREEEARPDPGSPSPPGS